LKLQNWAGDLENHSFDLYLSKIRMLNDSDRRLLRHFRTTPTNRLRAGRGGGPAAGHLLQAAGAAAGAGVLKGQRATVNWAALGYAVEVSLRITLDKTEPRAFDEFLAAAREVPEVTEIQTFLGRSMRAWP
jgi:Lrp/AsnC family transcriptional regulator